mmetsp:Transcript_12368/g.20061  ORF Transcript_12368/g.20061 Transcript_12368/m.20061 type:complete len:699 (+) Transcript_12368:23-2119(+)
MAARFKIPRTESITTSFVIAQGYPFKCHPKLHVGANRCEHRLVSANSPPSAIVRNYSSFLSKTNLSVRFFPKNSFSALSSVRFGSPVHLLCSMAVTETPNMKISLEDAPDISVPKELETRVLKALHDAYGDAVKDAAPMVTSASKPEFGDYQCNAAMPLAKVLGKPPRKIAEEIIKHIEVKDMFKPPTIAGPGFINFAFTPEYMQNRLRAMQVDERMGVPKAGKRRRVLVDFSSPNIAKEMHVGHLRSTIIGECIARILEFRGHDVLRINHVGDWGTQFGMLITYLREKYPAALTTQDALDLGDLVVLYKEAKARFDIDEEFKETSRKEVVKLQSGNEEARRAWQLLCDQSRREFQKIYDALDVRLTERGESYYNSMLPDVVKDLNTLKLLNESDGCKVVWLEGVMGRDGTPQPCIIQKTDGGYNYDTTDLAAIRYRVNIDKADRIIYVTDAGQAVHFQQVFQVARRAGWLPDTVEVVHVPFGLVQGEDGKKLKTRSGETVRLQELLDEAVERTEADMRGRFQAATPPRVESDEFIKEVARIVGLSAVKYADLNQNRTSNYIFSFDKMLALTGNTAPYMLYAYVRIQGISREGGIDFDELIKGGGKDLILQDESELSLARQLLTFAEIIREVEADLLPNRLCAFLYETSAKFNQFYERCQVVKAEEPLRTSRLMLCFLTARVIRLGLSLLGIPVIQRM